MTLRYAVLMAAFLAATAPLAGAHTPPAPVTACQEVHYDPSMGKYHDYLAPAVGFFLAGDGSLPACADIALAGCVVNVGVCTGFCLVNVGLCDGGACGVTVGTCSGECTVNVGDCPGVCRVNVGTCSGACAASVGSCAGFCTVNVGDCTGSCTASVGDCQGSCTLIVGSCGPNGTCLAQVGSCTRALMPYDGELDHGIGGVILFAETGDGSTYGTAACYGWPSVGHHAGTISALDSLGFGPGFTVAADHSRWGFAQTPDCGDGVIEPCTAPTPPEGSGELVFALVEAAIDLVFGPGGAECNPSDGSDRAPSTASGPSTSSPLFGPGADGSYQVMIEPDAENARIPTGGHVWTS